MSHEGDWLGDRIDFGKGGRWGQGGEKFFSWGCGQGGAAMLLIAAGKIRAVTLRESSRKRHRQNRSWLEAK